MEKIFGISFNAKQDFDISNEFEQVSSFEDGEEENVFVSKKIYDHDNDPDIEFKYQYVITCWVSPENNICYYQLRIVPTFESLHQSRKDEVVDFCGCEQVSISDMIECGMNVIMDSTSSENWYDQKIVDRIAQVIDTIDSFFGFYLDKYQNRIGTTGWDMMYDFIKGKDWDKATFARLKKAK